MRGTFKKRFESQLNVYPTKFLIGSTKMVSGSDKAHALVYKEKILHICGFLVNVHRPNLREEVSLWHNF